MARAVALLIVALVAGCSLSVGPYQMELLQNTRLILSTNHADPNAPD